MESRLKAGTIIQFGDGGAMRKVVTNFNNYEHLK